jgi:CHASE3 domain sensor protein
MKLKLRVKENALFIAIAVVFLLIITGSSLSFYNRSMMRESLVVKAQVDAVLSEIDRLQDNIRFMDISARGYALMQKKSFLFWNVKNAQQLNTEVIQNLDLLFEKQHLTLPEYDGMKKTVSSYTVIFAKMIHHIENNELDQYKMMLDYDYGKEFYLEYTPFLDSLTARENKITVKAQTDYSNAVMSNQVVQSLLFIVGLPTLYWIFRKIRKDNRERRRLLLDLEINNKQFIFDNGRESEGEAKKILVTSIRNFQEASRFVGEIAGGNYDVEWSGMTPEQKELNKVNLAGKLLFMRDEMLRMKHEDEKRLWVSTGLSQVSDIISKYQNNQKELTWQILTFFVKYSGSQQGGFFVVREADGVKHIELAACYAFERKKFMEKKLEIGEGLIGEVYLSGETLMIKEIPQNYLTITSGLGDATPNCMVIVPLKHNGQVEAIVELASFYEYAPYQIQLFEKAGEFIASALFTVEQNERNQVLMEQMRQQTEQLQAQEEELKQNFEELEATHESMRRQTLDN